MKEASETHQALGMVLRSGGFPEADEAAPPKDRHATHTGE